jgi:inorganic pyrophosphatase
MVDDGELDWKVLAIALRSFKRTGTTFNRRSCLNPGRRSGMVCWYKTPDDVHNSGFSEKYLNKTEAGSVIEETHEAWKAQVGETEKGKLWLGE